jgi:fucokinase
LQFLGEGDLRANGRRFLTDIMTVKRMSVPFDLLILTARHREQQWLFQRRLEYLDLSRSARAALVVPDPPGPFAGSGGATVYALCAALDRLGISLPSGTDAETKLQAQLAGHRILILHCGGMSQRVPQYSSLGKAFMPATRAAGTTLFEEILLSVAGMAGELPSGVLVACGDALYRPGGPVRWPVGPDAVAWACPVGVDLASRHGVFLWDRLTGRVTRTLQKASPLELQQHQVQGTVPLDTGVVFFSPRVAAALVGCCGDRRGGKAQKQAMRQAAAWQGLDLYRDMLPALSAEGKRNSVSGASLVIKALLRFHLHALCPERGEFLHLGTNEEFLRALEVVGNPDARVIDSVLDPDRVALGSGTVLHLCDISGPMTVGRESFLLGLRTRGRNLTLPSGCVAFQVPLRAAAGRSGREVLVVLDRRDDPSGGSAGTLLGEPLVDWADTRGLTREDLWAGVCKSERSLWNARLFPAGPADGLSESADWLCGGQSDAPAPGVRLSLHEIQENFDGRRWWRHERGVRARNCAWGLNRQILVDSDRPLAELTAAVPYGMRPAVLQELEKCAQGSEDRFHAARLWRACAELAGSRDVGSPYHLRAFGSIRIAVTGSTANKRWRLDPGTQVEVQVPVRIDLAGGWTDTPPQACEWGGAVLNAAFRLNGRAPISVRGRVFREPILRFRSVDTGEELECRDMEELLAYEDPSNPFALHKAALLEAGLIGSRRVKLKRHFEAIGGGLELETHADVPKGSGLGASSILGAAVLACLYRLAGEKTDWLTLYHAVLRLEQRMTTGGGWQDQIGGLLPGVKLTRTLPGVVQSPEVIQVPLSPERVRELEDRLVLFYTGVPRLARDVLQRVVDRYLAREPQAMAILRRMKELAVELAEALTEGDLSRVGVGMTESWELNRQLEPTSTNPDLDRLFAAITPHCSGAKMAGAGGGGFLVALARSSQAASRLRELLPACQPSGILYNASLAERGIEVKYRPSKKSSGI